MDPIQIANLRSRSLVNRRAADREAAAGRHNMAATLRRLADQDHAAWLEATAV